MSLPKTKMDILGFLKGLFDLVNKLIELFKKTPQEKQEEDHKKIDDENAAVKDGGRPKWE